MTFIRVGEYIFGGYTDRDWRKYTSTVIHTAVMAGFLFLISPGARCVTLAILLKFPSVKRRLSLAASALRFASSMRRLQKSGSLQI